MPDAISRLSAEVARNPGGRASIALAEELRRAGRLRAAEEAAQRALVRHPYDADAHDTLARIAADLGDAERARDEWEMALRLDPAHVATLLGLAFLAYRRGDHAEARRRAVQAKEKAPGDPRVEAALSMIDAMPPAADTTSATTATPAPKLTAPLQKPLPEPLSPHTIFAAILAGGATGVLLVDRDGLVVAGEARDAQGADVADDLAAELAGLGGESGRALEQLGLGDWDCLTVECEGVALSIAPAFDENLVLVATSGDTPIGMARVLLGRARRRADRWLEVL